MSGRAKFMPIIPATHHAEAGGPRSKASLGKVSGRPYLKKKLKAKGLWWWLKW
jgi:hypothetical protein